MTSGDMAAACRAATDAAKVVGSSPAFFAGSQTIHTNSRRFILGAAAGAGGEGHRAMAVAVSVLSPRIVTEYKDWGQEESQRARLYSLAESDFIEGPGVTAEAAKRKLHQEAPAVSSRACTQETGSFEDQSTRTRLALALRKAQREHSAAEIAAQRVWQLVLDSYEDTRLAFEAVIRRESVSHARSTRAQNAQLLLADLPGARPHEADDPRSGSVFEDPPEASSEKRRFFCLGLLVLCDDVECPRRGCCLAMVVGLADGFATDSEMGMAILPIFGFLIFFFSIWNFVMSRLVLHMWAGFAKNPTVNNCICAVGILFLPHVAVGLLVPLFAGGLVLWVIAMWPWVFNFIRMWQQGQFTKVPEAPQPPSITSYTGPATGPAVGEVVGVTMPGVPEQPMVVHAQVVQPGPTPPATNETNESNENNNGTVVVSAVVVGGPEKGTSIETDQKLF
ncbi:hypothetical protein AK812_SmicGene17521 [Symbiodinium microadriaticum]|uniref:Uncharacterized protein n=1 Tax=Symbiodinium microadriaticum TaxID=2951 RepID=A0A1Q9DXI3_SYMMI|nr:hypothetical protein AK812_SmicGene17521 [Symbiodinium microadriaticum]